MFVRVTPRYTCKVGVHCHGQACNLASSSSHGHMRSDGCHSRSWPGCTQVVVFSTLYAVMACACAETGCHAPGGPELHVDLILPYNHTSALLAHRPTCAAGRALFPAS